ncbi:unnamed protein product [Camellia sinensis]
MTNSVSDADKLNRRLVRLKSTNRTRERLRRDGFLGLFGHKVDLLDYHEKKLQDLEDNMRIEQSSLVGK